MASFFTHFTIGVLGYCVMLVGNPALSFAYLVSCVVGSTFPDIDVLFGEHRKTFHYASVYVLLFSIVFVGGLFYGFSLPIKLLLVFSFALFFHCFIDYFSSSVHVGPGEEKFSIYTMISSKWLRGYNIFEAGTRRDSLLSVIALIPILTVMPVDWTISSVSTLSCLSSVIFYVYDSRIGLLD